MKKYCVSINIKHCKACGICIGLCPKKVFTADYLGKAVVSNEDQCSGCQICEMQCPDFCIEVGGQE